MPSKNDINESTYYIVVNLNENEIISNDMKGKLNTNPRSKKDCQTRDFILENYHFPMGREEYEKRWEKLGLLPISIVDQIIQSGDYFPDEYDDMKRFLKPGENIDQPAKYSAIYEHSRLTESALKRGLVKPSIREREEEIVQKKTIQESYFEITEQLALPDYTGDARDE